jgi:DNA-binding CsgD family transcriptional regulator
LYSFQGRALISEDICERLKIKKTTAYWYRNQLFDKLQIKSTRELFALAGERPERDDSGGGKS